MRNERIVSMGTNSLIYHKQGCRYVLRIKRKNRMHLSKQAAEDMGYRLCKCCNSMNHHYATERKSIALYREKKLEFNYIAGSLYVKSEIGCWKLVYARREDKIAIYHRSRTDKPLDFTQPQYEIYHRQKDKMYASGIASALHYIYEHDKYRAAVERGEKIMKFSNEKYRRRETKVQWRRQCRRIDSLFKTLEEENPEYKKLSFC